ncbi:hypothetical protein M2277_005509 [Paenibacillus sp. LBL]|uniref:hypothetical protein n=1 Tax=Paenibacillus sp. LBL TaxID=2940563 RepID=UPI0024764E45|nr:hypothetical protein [Paenibacillus sp. LBL]MDH6674812.1 hypothetical protein [Paenibacillus sp. LBL]
MKVSENQQYEPQPTGWDALILLGSFILFPVILLPVLWKFISSTHLNYRKGYSYYQLTNCLIGGYIFTVMYYFFVPYSEFEPSQRANKAMGLALAVGIIGILIVAVLYGLRLRANKRFYTLAKEYESLVSNGLHSIEDIALHVHQPLSAVLKDLQYLLNHKLFPNGIIKEGRVRLNAYNQHSDKPGMESTHNLVHNTDETPLETTVPPGPKSHECIGCGNKVMLNPLESLPCEYCGLPLTYT